MDNLQSHAQCALKKFQQERFEIGELSAAAGPCKRQSRGDHQRTEQLHRAHPFITIRDLEREAWRRSLGRTDTLASLDRGLLITAYHRFALRRQLLRVLVEVENRGRLCDKLRIGRVLPRVITPGFDLIRAQPGTNRPWRDALHELLLNRHLREFLSRPAHPRFAVFPWRTTGERRDLGPLERREGASGAGTRRIAQHCGGLPAAAPLPDGLSTSTDLASNISIAPVGMV